MGIVASRAQVARLRGCVEFDVAECQVTQDRSIEKWHTNTSGESVSARRSTNHLKWMYEDRGRRSENNLNGSSRLGCPNARVSAVTNPTDFMSCSFLLHQHFPLIATSEKSRQTYVSTHQDHAVLWLSMSRRQFRCLPTPTNWTKSLGGRTCTAAHTVLVPRDASAVRPRRCDTFIEGSLIGARINIPPWCQFPP